MKNIKYQVSNIKNIRSLFELWSLNFNCLSEVTKEQA